MKTGPLFLFVCVSLAKILESAHVHAADTGKRSPGSKALPEWQEVSCLVSSREGAKQVCGKKSHRDVFLVRYRGLENLDAKTPFAVPVTAFVTATEQPWVGPEQDFYIETESGILGGTKWNGSSILWCESLVAKRKHQRNDLAAVLRRFRWEVSASRLADACDPEGDQRYPTFGETRPPLMPQYRVKLLERRFTILSSLSKNFFGYLMGGYDLQVSKMTGATITLDLRDKSGHVSATIWIDIKSREVVTAEENGKQVFPK